MVTTTLLISSIVVTAMGVLYILVGRAVLEPSAGRPERWARDAFALWWFGFAANTILGASQKAMASFGLVDVALFASLGYLQWLFLSAGLAGLMYYLLYLYMGTERVMYPIVVFYGLFYLAIMYTLTAMSPSGVEVRTWNLGLVYDSQPGVLWTNILLIALVVPILIAAALYLFLYFKVDEKIKKIRIVLVGGAFLFWFGSGGIAIFTAVGDWAYWPLMSRIIALVSAFIILYAFTRLERRGGAKTGNPLPGAGKPDPERSEAPRRLDHAVVARGLSA
jgi:hypothetical protein